jgi:hypothetical protein
MFPKTKEALVFLAVTLSAAFVAGVAVSRAAENGPLRVQTRIVKQSYCLGDRDLFMVSLKLDVHLVNISKDTVGVNSTMTPWVAKVAQSVSDAEAGQFLFEQTWSHYRAKPKSVEMVSVKPGDSFVVHTGYDLNARYNAAFSYAKSVAAGGYAIVLVFRPEIDSPVVSRDMQPIESVTTEPISIEVSKRPNVEDCTRRRDSK